MIEDIKNKIDTLINATPNFNESQVVYILVESYKIAERKWPDQFKKQIPYIVFFRNWVTHTEIYKKSELTVTNIINDGNLKTEQLQKEILLILNDPNSIEKLKSMWPSFKNGLMSVLQDQPVFLNQKIEIQKNDGQFSIQIQ